MSRSYIDKNKQTNTDNHNFEVNKKKIDPVAQLKWLNNHKVDYGFGVFGANGETVQMFSQDEEESMQGKIEKDLSVETSTKEEELQMKPDSVESAGTKIFMPELKGKMENSLGIDFSGINMQQNLWNTTNEVQKKIDPVAQLKWLNNHKVDYGWGVFGDNETPVQMFAQDEEDLVQKKEKKNKSDAEVSKGTDFLFNSKTGEFNQISKNDKGYDRILKTNRSGDVKMKGDGFLVKKSEKRKPKVAMNNIPKGILRNGINFNIQDNVIEVGGSNQPTVADVESFIFKLSNIINKEIGGYYLSDNNSKTIKYVYVSRYIKNKADKAYSPYMIHNTRPDLQNNVKTRTHFHTHLSSYGDSDRLRPSEADEEFKKGQKDLIEKFIIVTNPENVKY